MDICINNFTRRVKPSIWNTVELTLFTFSY